MFNGIKAFEYIKPSKVIGKTDLAPPMVGTTQTFISAGDFETAEEAVNCQKYLKTKFARGMLSIAKVTQDNRKDTWQYIPMQDFTSNSDIDWSKSIADIDNQLFKKYKIPPEESIWIKIHVADLE